MSGPLPGIDDELEDGIANQANVAELLELPL